MNIVQRLGRADADDADGDVFSVAAAGRNRTLTRISARSQQPFLLLCVLHAALFAAALRLPLLLAEKPQ